MERYEKIRVIGQGAFGKVFLVNRKSDGSHLVFKQIPVDDLPKLERQSALNEVKVLKLLKHPNIIAYYDKFMEDKSLTIVMEYAPGGTLHEFIQERNSSLMEEDHVLQFFVQLLVAIDHVHSLNILHRDMKTQNVMMNRNKTVLKIGDFGISKVLSSKITSAQTVVGTPCYISPEICEGRMYAKKSDIWALGCILYEMTTLRKAFEGPNLPVLVLKIMQASASLQPIDSTYNHRLEKLIHSLLQRKPEDRPSIYSVMASPVVMNALMNLCTDVGRLPYTRHSRESIDTLGNLSGVATSTTSPPRPRMGSLGKFRQRSFFQDNYEPCGHATKGSAPSKPVLYLWGGSSFVPITLNPPVTLTDSKIVGVACGRMQRVGITEDGKLISWELVSGSLSTTRFTMMHTKGSKGGKRELLLFEPRLVGGLKTTVIKKVACGDMFTACLTDKGILMTFGSGVNGCLGHGNSNEVTEPKLVDEMLAFETLEIACGANHMMAITAEGGLFAWGKGDKGQLGLGSSEDQYSPRLVQLPADTPPVLVSCGLDSSVILTESGQLLACGNNRCNKLSLNETDSQREDKQQTLSEPSSSQSSNSTTSTLSITSTLTSPSQQNQTPKSLHTPMISELSHSSHVTTHGMDSEDPQETNCDIRNEETPVISHMTNHSVGSGRTPAILSLIRGQPSSVGGSKYLSIGRQLATAEASRQSCSPGVDMGSVGSVPMVSVFTPSGSQLVTSHKIVSVAMGTNHMAMITASRECLTCGDNSYGQLGYLKDKSESGQTSQQPGVVTALSGKPVEMIACGDFFTTVCCKGGEVYSWGCGLRGRLGRDTSKNVHEPMPVPFEALSQTAQAMVSSHSVTLMLTTPGT